MQKQILNSLLCIWLFLPAAAAAADSSTIGALAELSGNFARLGEDCRRGYEVAQASFPSPARVIFGDNQNDPKAAISEYRRLLDTEHAAIVVTTRSAIGLALNPLSVRQKTPLIGVVGHPRFIAENPYAVRVFPAAADEAQVLASKAIANDESAIGIISLEDEYFLGLKSEFENRVTPEKVVFSETIAPAEQDFAALVLRIKAKSPTALFINVGPAQFVPLVKRIKEAGVAAHLYANFLIGSADIRKGLGENGNGIIFVELDYEKSGFLKALAEKTGSAESSPLGYSCYVALTYALELDRLASTKNISLIEASKAITEITTLDGQVPFAGREAKFLIIPKTIRNGVAMKL